MTLSAPATVLTAAVTLLALLVVLGLAIAVSRTRNRVGIQPPATTGSPELECALRAHGNAVEQVIIFLPALWLAALYFQGWIPPILGLCWCLGRIIYALGYKPGNPRGRYPGFFISMISTLALIVLAAIGVFGAWTAAGAI